jgi:transposase-like protein
MESMKASGDQSVFWDQSFVHESRQAVANVIHGRRLARVARHLEQCRQSGCEDRRNGSYARHLTTGLDDALLKMPRTRCYSPVEVIGAYGRRAPEVDRLIADGVRRGHSTCKVAEALLPILGSGSARRPSATSPASLMQRWRRSTGGGRGLLAALPLVYPICRCSADGRTR